MVHKLGLKVTSYVGGMRQGLHRHDELHLSMVLRGRLSERVGAYTEYASAFSVVAKDPDLHHANVFGPGPVLIAQLSLPGHGLSVLIDDVHPRPPWQWTHRAEVARPFLRLARRAGRGTTSLTAHDDDIVELLAALTAHPVTASSGDAPRWLAETLERVRQEWSPSLSVRDVAAWAGVHPVYLARCTRRWFGHGVHSELRRLRLAAAADALTATSGSVSAVAHATGFSDEPHLCRAFRAIAVTAGAYRAIASSVADVQGATVRGPSS
jgi:AraC-like DNA-binding protein